MDRRLTPATDRVAHVSLKGALDRPAFTEGTPAVVVHSVVDLLPSPEVNGRTMDRQLLLGDTVRLLEYHAGFAFVICDRDGYVGWVQARDINEDALAPATHLVATRATHLYRQPDMKASRRARQCSLGSRLHVVRSDSRFAELIVAQATDKFDCPEGRATYFVPASHLRPIDQPETDPVAVAERLLGTPYLWGGNSAFGIDCSGLVQIACHACDIPCPGDSDLQQAHFPAASTPDYQRGDLLFWKGHVAWIADPETLLHANAHHMSVTCESIASAIQRIQSQGDGPVTLHARPHLLGLQNILG